MPFTFVSPEAAGALGTGSIERHNHSKGGSHIPGRWRGQQETNGVMGFPEGLRILPMLIQNIPSIHLGETLWLGVTWELPIRLAGHRHSNLPNIPVPSLTLSSPG